eukprot:Seg1927.4 transcript_id=Seg1927.4/GoldUCD/mRNA.D3Y31 product="Glycoprotein-associated amino acid transporter b0,+AT1" protein_id=Seg1927.4/GoldUCD/D3Y31
MLPSAETQSINEPSADENLVPKQDEEAPPKLELKKRLSLLNGVGFVVGTIIGAGIFISPAGVMKNAGSVGLSLCVWFACGVIASVGALCYCELGTAIPKTGAEYQYLLASFGPVPSFLFAWTAVLIIKPAAIAGVSMVFGEYMTKPFYEGKDSEPPMYLVKLVGFSSIGKCLLFLSFDINDNPNLQGLVSLQF